MSTALNMSSSASAGVAPRRVIRGANSHTTAQTTWVSRIDERELCIDWIRASGPSSCLAELVALIREATGHDEERGLRRDFLSASRIWPHGSYVAFDESGQGSANHCVVCFPGEALRNLRIDVFDLLRRLCSLGFRLTRLDIAEDWNSHTVGALDDVVNGFEASAMRGEFKGRPIITDSSSHKPASFGEDPICLCDMRTLGKRGSHGSGRYVKIYDKGLETKDVAKGTWIRLEVELYDDCAAQAGHMLTAPDLSASQVFSLMRSILLGSIEAREPTNRDWARRAHTAWFAELRDLADTLRLTRVRRSSTYESWMRWHTTCVAPAIKRAATLANCSIEQVFDYLIDDQAVNKHSDIMPQKVLDLVAELEVIAGRQDNRPECLPATK